MACGGAFAQNSENAQLLIKQGTQLNDEGKYAEAIEKYNEALKADPENHNAEFELAYTLYLSGKGVDGIPYLEKVIAANTSLTAGAYDLLGTIYDKDDKKDKAIAAYNAGIKANPDYQRLHYNLGLVYFRHKQYAEAESCAIDAIKLDPKHASSQRMYALVCFHQNKRVPALLGFCSFLLLEPNSSRSAEAFGNIQHILQGGVIKGVGGPNTIILSSKGDQAMNILNMAISLSVIAADRQKNLSPEDRLEMELRSIFKIAGEQSEQRTDKDFFWKYYADYFYKVAQSDNVPAFTRLINSSTADNANWIKDHQQQMADLDNWVKTTVRGF